MVGIEISTKPFTFQGQLAAKENHIGTATSSPC
jgi:hypothetical protein